MPTLDEQFEQWLKKETAADGHVYVTNGDAFHAGATAERERVLGILHDAEHSSSIRAKTWREITRRIKEQE